MSEAGRGMTIWVDGDACPQVIKEILFRAADRTGLALVLVANQPVRVPSSPRISMLRVAAGFDAADSEIARRMQPGDLVITADIPLAADVIAKHGHALSPRGELFTPGNIGERLNIRDFMDTMRASGVNTGGPRPLNQADRKAFADRLDQLLTKHANPA